MSKEAQRKRDLITIIIDNLELIREDANIIIEEMQASEAYPPDIDTDELFDQVIDVLNCVDHELKHRP